MISLAALIARQQAVDMQELHYLILSPHAPTLFSQGMGASVSLSVPHHCVNDRDALRLLHEKNHRGTTRKLEESFLCCLWPHFLLLHAMHVCVVQQSPSFHSPSIGSAAYTASQLPAPALSLPSITKAGIQLPIAIPCHHILNRP